MTQRALIILHPGFEEIEAVTPIDILKRADFEILVVSTGPDLEVEGRSGIRLTADCLVDRLEDQPFDVIVLPGGPGIARIRRHERVCDLLQKQFAANRLIACICAAPLLLKDAELTDELALTGHPSIEGELSPLSPRPVVNERGVITSRGAGTAVAFALEIVRELRGDTADAIAEAICWQAAS